MDGSGAIDGRSGSRDVGSIVPLVVLGAIAILIVAVVATWAIGAGGAPEPHPRIVTTTQYDERWTGNGQYLTITLEDGDTLTTDRLQLEVDDAFQYNPQTGERDDVRLDDPGGEIASQVGAEFSPTETVVIDRRAFSHHGSALNGSEQIDLYMAKARIVYTAPDTGRESILYECTLVTPACAQPGH